MAVGLLFSECHQHGKMSGSRTLLVIVILILTNVDPVRLFPQQGRLRSFVLSPVSIAVGQRPILVCP